MGGLCIGACFVLTVLITNFQQCETITAENCHKMDSYSLICNNSASIPRNVPESIQRVILHDIDLNQCRRGVFSNESWLYVLQLHIHAESGFDLLREVFVGLDNLIFLKLRGLHLTFLAKESFRGLPKLAKLDLSDNYFLETFSFFDVLRDSITLTMPYLNWLDLSRAQIYYNFPISLNNESFTILSKREIEVLNFTGCTLGPVDVIHMCRVCDDLKHLVLNDVTLTGPSMTGINLTECTSLKILEMRNLNSVDLENLFRLFLLNIYDAKDILDEFVKPVLGVEKLIMDNVFQNKLDINVKLNFTSYAFSLTHVDFSSNNLRVFNGSVLLHPKTRQNIKDLDFSHNIIEYMSPFVLGASTNLERLNLSHNSFKSMIADYSEDFDDLFKNLTNLQIIDMSNNELVSLPKFTFLHNAKLQEIYLARNLLTVLDFKFDHMPCLQFLDLHDNEIKAISIETILQCEHIWAIPKLSKIKESITNGCKIVDRPVLQIHDNPLVCECDEGVLEVHSWITLSGHVNHAPAVTCSLNDKNILVFPTALEKTKQYCHAIKVRLYLSVGGGIAAAIVFVFVSTFVLIRRRVWKRNAVKIFTRNVRNGEKLKYLIFLSFCSEDGDTVLKDILPAMQKEASKALNCDRNLVCCGELDFKPGQSVCLEVMRCMEESAVVIFAISDTFCEKDWCKMEVKEAKDQRKPAILLFLEKVDPERMTPYLKKLFRRYSRASWIREASDGHPHPNWPTLVSSVIELGATFEAENTVETNDDEFVINAEFINETQ